MRGELVGRSKVTNTAASGDLVDFSSFSMLAGDRLLPSSSVAKCRDGSENLRLHSDRMSAVGTDGREEEGGVAGYPFDHEARCILYVPAMTAASL